MKVGPFSILRHSTLLAACILVLVARVAAQEPPGGLRGQVTDPSGAAVTDAVVLLTTPAGASLDATTNKEGFYEFKTLAAGNYQVKVVAPGFAVFASEALRVASGQTQKLDVRLTIEVQKEEVNVNDSSTNVDVNPANNSSTVVMSGKDLDPLSDDPDQLQSDLEALAGPSAGPNGGQIYIDGFTGGKLPPKSSIREIRINQNPFSAEYDRLGYGRIEVLTKPGTDKFHGQLFLSGNSSAFNSRNPFEHLPAEVAPPGYESTQFSANAGGPLGKKASVFLDFERRDINELSVVSAQVVDSGLNVVPFSDAVANPRTRINLSPRLDYQLTPTNTLTFRYQYERENEDNNGIGQFDLPSVGFNQRNREHQIQLSDTQILNAKVVNETRFRFVRETNDLTPLGASVNLEVQGAFTSGGNVNGRSTDTLDRYEVQNSTSMALGKHFLKFGARFRVNRDENTELQISNGQFTFSSIGTYLQTLENLAAGQPPRANGGGASQYVVSTGSARGQVTYFDAGPYFQDDWRLRPNVTLSYGLRVESQNNIRDHVDVAPRVGIAWGIGGGEKKAAPKAVLRAGFGIFYDRFMQDLILQQERLNGVIQQQFVFANPDFYLDPAGNPPSLAVLLATQQTSAIAPTLYRPNPDLRTPYTMQVGVSLERQLSKTANLAVTYLGSRGLHQFFTENINPPACASFPCDPAANPHPEGVSDNVYQYQSGGTFKQNQLIVNSSIRLGARLSLFGYYTLSYANSDTAGAGSFPSASNNISLDYGRAPFDVRHRLFMGGSISLPHAFRLSPFLIASSGNPFTLTTGRDSNGDSVFNDRPSRATGSSDPQNVVVTSLGSFDLVPQPGDPLVPVNSLAGEPRFTLNLRVSKTFGFGKKTEAPSAAGMPGGPGGGTFGRGPGGPGRGGFRGPGGPDGSSSGQRYGLTFSVSARNIFNNVNLATPIGNLSSPFFGQSNALAGGPFSSSTANRRLDLQLTFTF